MIRPTYMSNHEVNVLVSDAAVLIRALFSSKRLLISANSEICVVDSFVEDD